MNKTRKDDNLNMYASSALTVPFAKMNSMARLDMAQSAMKHSVVPTNPEYPIVDSAYTNDILFSTDDKVEMNGVKLLYKIPKIINNVLCETCYIYESLGTGIIKLVIVPTYAKCYKFGYKTKSEFENMEVGDIKTGKTYVKHFSHLDIDNNIVSFGVNVPFIYDITEDVGEDSIVISRELANKFARPFNDTIEIMVSSDYIMRNLYGNDELYKPIPLPGDEIKDGLIAAMYVDDSKSFIAYNDDEILDSDSKYMIQFDHGAKVVDIEIYSKDPVTRIPIIEEIRKQYLSYMRQVAEAITSVFAKYPKDRVHYSLENLRGKYSLIINGAALGSNMTEMKSSVLLRITTVKNEPLQPGDKITNRHGGKGTIARIVDTPLTDEWGNKIHAIINATGVMNRENPAQLYEAGLTSLWTFFQRYLQQSNDSVEDKFKNLLGWLEHAKQPRQKEYLSKLDPNEVVEYYKNNYMAMTYYPYNNPDESDILMEFNTMVELVDYTNKFEQSRPLTIYDPNGIEIGAKHYVQNMFFMVLSNGPYKDTSIRGSDGVNSKGNPTKSDKDKKKYRTKFGTTGVKLSDLALNIFLNPLYESDKHMLKNNTLPLHDYLRVMGRKLVFTPTDNDGGENNDKD